MALDDQHHSHSRLTRFLSKFTLNSNHHHSKRKNSSLPNLTQKPILVEQYNQQNQTINNKRSISQGNYNNNQSNPVTPLLPLPTIIDNSNNPSSSSIQEEDDEGADPNASIRPITPSSKALSITTHDTTDSPNQPKQRTTTHQHHHHQHQHHSSRNRPASSNSDTCSEPLDDAKSTFGNSSFASTKPTTVISLENGPTNRIAQPHYHHSPAINHHHHHHHHHSLMAQPAAHNQYHHPIRAAILTHQAAQSTTSESSLNQSHQQQQQQQQQQTFTPTLTLHSSPPLSPQNQLSLITVPRHSLPHPSQNPHPAALADNASIITLASSGFSPSLHQTQNFPSDEDASVRALAPSRRESIESLSSRWSNVKSHRTGGSIMTTGTGFYTGISTASTGDCHAAPCVEPTTTSLHEVAAAINSSTAIATAPLDVVLHPKHLSGEDFHHHQYLPPDLDPTPTIELHNPSPPPIPPSPPTEEKTQLAILPIHPSHPIEQAPVLD